MLSQRAMSPMRVLHIVGESRFGGAAKIIVGLGHVAQAEGWQVDILATDPMIQQIVTQHGLGLVKLDVIRREIRPLWDFGGLVRLHRFLRQEPYQIVHTHTSKGGFVGRLAAKLAGVPLILHTAHGFAFHEGSPVRTRRIYSTLERIASGWCDRIVAVSEFHRKWAIELGMCSPGKIIAIPNGLADPGRNPNVNTAELRRQLGVGCEDLLILSISRLAPDKGLEYLIEASAIMPPMGRRLQIVIAGDGPFREQLERLAATLGVTDRVKFIGFRKDVGDLLAACDLMVLPSLREGLSISLLEAMAVGKPIVATNIGSQREVAAHGDMALLVRPADATALAESILRLVGDQALMARLGNKARAVYESFYTEEKMLQSYRQLYLDLLDAKRTKKAAMDSRKSGGLLGGRQEGLRQTYSELVSSPTELKGNSL
jgi:glycosyltransferase involved in cell wall biosynthesis